MANKILPSHVRVRITREFTYDVDAIRNDPDFKDAQGGNISEDEVNTIIYEWVFDDENQTAGHAEWFNAITGEPIDCPIGDESGQEKVN